MERKITKLFNFMQVDFLKHFLNRIRVDTVFSVFCFYHSPSLLPLFLPLSPSHTDWNWNATAKFNLRNLKVKANASIEKGAKEKPRERTEKRNREKRNREKRIFKFVIGRGAKKTLLHTQAESFPLARKERKLVRVLSEMQWGEGEKKDTRGTATSLFEVSRMTDWRHQEKAGPQLCIP